MYNLRYHIATLVSVFLALAIGLLLGTVVVERGLIDAQRTTLVQSIQNDVAKVRAESAALKATNANLSAFAGQAASELASDKLAGRTIVVLADPDSGDTVSRVQDALRLAGAKTAVATLVGPGLGLDDAKVKQAAMTALGSPEPSQLETRVVDALVREWSTPDDPRDLTKALTAAGGLKLDGLAATDTVTGVVVTAVYGDASDASALKLARSLATQGRFGAGVETTGRRNGQAQAAVAAGLSGVDDVDSPLGQISLVWVLTGRATGSFGTAPGAGAAFPDPLVPVQ